MNNCMEKIFENKICAWIIFVSVTTFNTLLLSALAFVIGSSGIVFITLWINSGNDLNYIACILIVTLPFLPAMTVPAWLARKIPNWFDILENI